MLKTLTFSLGLALALGMSTVSLAGHNDSGCTTCGIASPQGYTPSAQSVIASPQCDSCGDTGGGCLSGLGGGMKHKLGGLFKHKPKQYTYEYVLKKKRVWGHKSNNDGCDTCGTAAPVTYASGQGTYAAPQGGYAAPQSYGSGQNYSAPSYGAPQAVGSGQATYAPGAIAPATLAGDVPPPPEVSPAGSISLTPAGN